MMEPFRTVLGTNKGVQRSRVWIEGDRLSTAGFAVGVRYRREIAPGQIKLTLDVQGVFKVSGKGSKPIIDITGKAVIQTFTGTHVLVTYQPGVITVNNEVVTK